MAYQSVSAAVVLGISAALSAGACATASKSGEPRAIQVCQMEKFRGSLEVFRFEAEYVTDGMSHTYFRSACNGVSVIDATARAHDSDGSFEAFLAARKNECANRGIVTACPVSAVVEGSGRVVKTPWGYALEVVSLGAYKFNQD